MEEVFWVACWGKRHSHLVAQILCSLTALWIIIKSCTHPSLIDKAPDDKLLPFDANPLDAVSKNNCRKLVDPDWHIVGDDQAHKSTVTSSNSQWRRVPTATDRRPSLRNRVFAIAYFCKLFQAITFNSTKTLNKTFQHYFLSHFSGI